MEEAVRDLKSGKLKPEDLVARGGRGGADDHLRERAIRQFGARHLADDAAILQAGLRNRIADPKTRENWADAATYDEGLAKLKARYKEVFDRLESAPPSPERDELKRTLDKKGDAVVA